MLVGTVIGGAIGGGGLLLLGQEPSVVIRNGVLEGWEVTRDNEELVCRDPIVFIRAKQIECD